MWEVFYRGEVSGAVMVLVDRFVIEWQENGGACEHVLGGMGHEIKADFY